MGIFIASNVTNEHMAVGLENILSLLPNDDNLTKEDWIEVSFYPAQLTGVADKITAEIDVLKEKRTFDESRLVPYTKLNYRGVEWSLNYKDRVDFKIAILISFYDIIYRTIDRNGFISLFNQTMLRELVSAEVFAILRSGNELTEVDILNRNIELRGKYEHVKELSPLTISESIKRLSDLGLIDKMDKQEVYCLTSKGYMLYL